MFKQIFYWAAVVAQLVEQSLPAPEIRSSNPAIGNFNNYIEKMKVKTTKKKRQGMAHYKNSGKTI